MSFPVVQTWFRIQPATETPRVRLICLPPAGGGVSAFRGWRELAPPWIELCPVQLPGRESRFGEPAAAGVEALVGDLATAVAALPRDGVQCALFGHSMGGILAYELAGRLEALGAPPLAQVVVSAAPSRSRTQPRDAEAFLRELGGAPAELWEYPDMVELVVGILRSDLALLHAHEPGDHVLAAPLAFLHGTRDPVAGEADVPWWRSRTSRDLRVERVDGGHAYLTENPAAVVAIVTGLLQAATRNPE